jgi:3-isopropylmalate/(R)-2-methylmalate dehydratase small subunit
VILEGRAAWVYGDDFDVDEIVGVENIRTFDIDHLRSVCMQSFTEGFVETIHPGDLLVAGRNFGYGHPHDQPMLVMREIGIAGVVAESFAPLFARTEIFNGFPLLACPGVSSVVRRWARLRVDWEEGRVTLVSSGQTLEGLRPAPEAVKQVRAGGGKNLLLQKLVSPS